MVTLNRFIKKAIIDNLMPNKVIVLLGARRTGKTELLKMIMEEVDFSYLFLNGDDFTTHDLLHPLTAENYKTLFADKNLLIIDEAQKIPDIGHKLKLIVDTVKGIHILVTGSSAFDLTNTLGEPLTGRKITFHLFPLAQVEYNAIESPVDTKSKLSGKLVYGNYPELLQYPSPKAKSTYLRELVNAYLLKDILEFEGIKNANKLRDLLRLLAFQTGKEVSVNELGRQLGLHKDTVSRYLDLLSKVFVIYRLGGFSRNLRKEVSKMDRWYFYDNGVRNILINNLNPLHLRNDQGELWENYILSERIKIQHYKNMLVSNYFWRTYQQQEIDWIEEREGKLFAYEMKWNPGKKVKIPSAWQSAYTDSEFQVIHSNNYLDWIC
ncbi:MAG: ATP-binding protein [Bacteroidales bacterium]